MGGISNTGIPRSGGPFYGPILGPNGSAAAPTYSFAGTPNSGLWVSGAGGTVTLSVSGSDTLYAIGGGGVLASVFLGVGGSQDLRWYRDIAGTSSQRNGINPQSSHMYNTFTDASNGEWFGQDWTATANTLTLGTFQNGTGAARRLRIVSAAAYIEIGSHLITTASGGYDLGASSNSWRRIYLDYTNTATVGAVTINKALCRVNMAAGSSTLTLTNNLVTANSAVTLQALNASGNAVAVEFFPTISAGQIIVNASPAVTNQTTVQVVILSTD